MYIWMGGYINGQMGVRIWTKDAVQVPVCVAGTVAGKRVKSNRGSQMENADVQPACFSNTTHRDLKKNSAAYHHKVRGERKKLPKGFLRKQSFELPLRPAGRLPTDGKIKNTVF